MIAWCPYPTLFYSAALVSVGVLLCFQLSPNALDFSTGIVTICRIHARPRLVPDSDLVVQSIIALQDVRTIGVEYINKFIVSLHKTYELQQYS
jgi:hypothetical protein